MQTGPTLNTLVKLVELWDFDTSIAFFISSVAELCIEMEVSLKSNVVE